MKGLYKKTRQGTVEEFTGISSPYEEPVAPDLLIDTANTTLEDSIRMVLSIQRLRGILPRQRFFFQFSISQSVQRA